MRWLFLLSCCFFFLQGFPQQQTEQAFDMYQEAYSNYKKNELGLARYLVDQSIGMRETADSRYLSGLIFEGDQLPLRAVSEYEAAVDLNPEYREAYFKKALIYLKHGNPEQAVRDFSYLINTYNRSEETTSIIFQIDESGGNQNKILTTNMLEAQLYHYRGQAYQKLDDYEKALADLNSALLLEPVPDYYISRGLLRVKMKNSAAARNDFKEAIEIDPDNSLAWYNLALIDDNLTLPPTLSLDSDFAPTLSLLASRAMDRGDYNQARQYLDQSLDIDPGDELSLINRGRAKLKLDQYSSARSDFVQAYRINPQRSESLYLTGNTYFYEKNYARALAYYNQFLAIDPGNGMVWYNAAMCHFELGDKQDACHFLSMANQHGMVQAPAMINRHCR